MSNIFRGLGVALITPFKSDMSIDFEALERLVNYQLDNGADFLCILATTGETPCLTRSEKDEITRVVKSVVKGRVPLLKYCGGNNTRAVIEEMKSSDWEGIDGILSICPYYNKPSQEGLYQHFKAIAEASPLPLVLYNVPGRTGVNMKAATTCRIAKDFPNIVGIKEASGNFGLVTHTLALCGDNINIWSGNDDQVVPLMALGAKGVISVVSNVYPQLMAEMTQLCLDGKFDEAAKLQVSTIGLVDALFIEVNPIPVKVAMNMMGLDVGKLRMPLCDMSAAHKEVLAKALMNAGLEVKNPTAGA